MPDNRPAQHQNYISTEDMRNFVLDRSVEDNVLDLDLTFSDEEIIDAMRRCARDYNSIPPLGVSSVLANQLPNDTTLFLNGTAKQMYLSALQKLMRQDFDYTAGGVQTNIVKARIEHFKFLIKMLGDEFSEQARAYKMNINFLNAFGGVG